MKQGERIINVTENKIQTFNFKVFSNAVFRINSFNKVFSIRNCWFCYISKFDFFPITGCLDSLKFKTEYGRNVLVQGIQYQ